MDVDNPPLLQDHAGAPMPGTVPPPAGAGTPVHSVASTPQATPAQQAWLPSLMNAMMLPLVMLINTINSKAPVSVNHTISEVPAAVPNAPKFMSHENPNMSTRQHDLISNRCFKCHTVGHKQQDCPQTR